MSLTKATYSMIQGAPANVLDYGADATGAADSTTAFNLALATGRPVYAPKGTYKINITLSTSNKTIYGDGIGVTTFKPYTATDPVITLNGDTAGEIIRNFLFQDFSVEGVTRQGNGFYIYGTADTRGCDQIVWNNISITYCSKGIGCYGRSIWNVLQNVYCDFNHDGIWIQTDQAVNAWSFDSVRTSRNQQHGLYAEKTDISIGGFLDFTFTNFNSEYNGQDTSIPFIYGVYCNGIEGWSFQNVTLEQNGTDSPSVESYGMLIDGALGRGVIIDGVWGVDSDIIIAIRGAKKSGSINNIYRAIPYAGGYTIYITASWSNDEPKIELGPDIFGPVYVANDINGNSPITQGVDYYGAAQTTLAFKNKKRATIATTSAGSTISSITGLINGDVIFLYNFSNGGANKVTLAAGLMANATAYDINPDTGKQFMVLGDPLNGKLVPI